MLTGPLDIDLEVVFKTHREYLICKLDVGFSATDGLGTPGRPANELLRGSGGLDGYFKTKPMKWLEIEGLSTEAVDNSVDILHLTGHRPHPL
jgi:hypothetical protein